MFLMRLSRAAAQSDNQERYDQAENHDCFRNDRQDEDVSEQLGFFGYCANAGRSDFLFSPCRRKGGSCYCYCRADRDKTCVQFYHFFNLQKPVMVNMTSQSSAPKGENFLPPPWKNLLKNST